MGICVKFLELCFYNNNLMKAFYKAETCSLIARRKESLFYK
jgi:hypothetical protein